ncbi:MAG: transcriptional regulator [Actinomycetota bacterium]
MIGDEDVGQRLRSVRLQRGLSLHDVEKASSGEFKASVLGAYERGDRSMSVPRLRRLAHVYGVPPDRILAGAEQQVTQTAADEGAVGGLRIDLQAVNTAKGPETEGLARFCNMVQMMRGDFNGKVLTIRRDDVRAIAGILDVPAQDLAHRLSTLGVARPTVSWG